MLVHVLEIISTVVTTISNQLCQHTSVDTCCGNGCVVSMSSTYHRKNRRQQEKLSRWATFALFWVSLCLFTARRSSSLLEKQNQMLWESEYLLHIDSNVHHLVSHPRSLAIYVSSTAVVGLVLERDRPVPDGSAEVHRQAVSLPLLSDLMGHCLWSMAVRSVSVLLYSLCCVAKDLCPPIVHGRYGCTLQGSSGCFWWLSKLCWRNLLKPQQDFSQYTVIQGCALTGFVITAMIVKKNSVSPSKKKRYSTCSLVWRQIPFTPSSLRPDESKAERRKQDVC